MLMLLVHSTHNCSYIEPHRDPTGNTLSSLLPLTHFFCKAVGSLRVHLRSLSSALVAQTRLCWIVELFHTLLRSFLLFVVPLPFLGDIFFSSYPSDHFHISFDLISFQPTQCYCHSEPHGGLKTKE